MFFFSLQNYQYLHISHFLPFRFSNKLYIINLLEEMQSACPNENFWCGLTADEWYPPNSIGVSSSDTGNFEFSI